MSETVIQQVEAALEAWAEGLHSIAPHAGSAWERLVGEVLEPRAGRRTERQECPSPLRDPVETRNAHADELADAAESWGRSGKRAGLLKTLAEWWLETFGEQDAAIPRDVRPEAVERLEGMRGLSPELAARIQLRALEMAVWPVTRAAQRICFRHGWLDPSADYDEWQSYFIRGSSGDADRLRALFDALQRIGQKFCGARPRCEDCPLQPLLRNGQPLDLNAE